MHAFFFSFFSTQIQNNEINSGEKDHQIAALCRAQLGVISVINSTHKLLMVSSHFS